VLHDVFAVPFAEIGTILGKSADATKMIASRARRKIRAAQQPSNAGRQQREVAQAFLTAARDGRFEQLMQVLHPEVKFTVHTPNGTFAAIVNGRPGLISWSEDGTPLALMDLPDAVCLLPAKAARTRSGPCLVRGDAELGL
jgi:RNA polymerase sigma-70 factor (ECF subfamily)